MNIELRVVENGTCPYLRGRRWRVEEFGIDSLNPAVYESLLVTGWRRSGTTFYKNRCENCELCIPLRLELGSFKPSPSQRRKARRNADLEVKLLPAAFTEERYSLYRRYLAARHGGTELPEPFAQAAYIAFLIANPLGRGLISEYRAPGGELLATGYLDLLPDGLSSVYFAFEPSAAGRSLGTWSVLRELEFAASLGRRFYYLGFWVPGSPSMAYKADFRPFEYARGGSWLPARDRDELLARLGAA